MVAALQLTSGLGAFLAFVVMAALFALWVIALFALVTDSISGWAKVGWFVAITCLAPIAIPVYLVLRHRRNAQVTFS